MSMHVCIHGGKTELLGALSIPDPQRDGDCITCLPLSLSLSVAQTHSQTSAQRHPSLQGQQDKLAGGEQLPSLPVNDN